MSYYESASLVSLISNAALSKNTFVQVETADSSISTVDDVDNAGIVGVCGEDASAAGDAVAVTIGGVAKVEAAGSITRGAKVASNTSGKAVALGAASRMCGIALSSAASGDVFPVLVYIGEKKA
tara:strand:+ start:4969 stop:5340 length:372 start_codon:yes stop_codon:yes gene_type:complete